MIEGTLDDGLTTVGSMINIKHLAPTPVGFDVRCECTLVKTEGRRLCFEIRIYDAGGCIAEVSHERFIVKTESFMAKALNRGKEKNE